MRLDVSEDGVLRSAKLEISVGDRQRRRERELNGGEENDHCTPRRRFFYCAHHSIVRSCKASHSGQCKPLRAWCDLRFGFSVRSSNRSNANCDCQQRQHLAHAERPGNESELCIRLSRKLDEIADQSVTH